MSKSALICGVSGQDGALLARQLISRGYRVFGTVRGDPEKEPANLQTLGLAGAVTSIFMSLDDAASVATAVEQAVPDEVYHLAGQSSVGMSFEQPAETMASIAVGTTHLLEALRRTGRRVPLCIASSSECFGGAAPDQPAHENTPFRPNNPYAVAKAAAFLQAKHYRETYAMPISSAILFNHESELRPERFVTRKVVSTACRIAAGSPEKLTLNGWNMIRDWGWADEYVHAMWLMLQADTAEDYVVATGESHSLRELVEKVFEKLGMDASDHVEIGAGDGRANEAPANYADPGKALRQLGWRAEVRFDAVIERMVAHDCSLMGLAARIPSQPYA